MKLRNFLGTIAVLISCAFAPAADSARQYYELRVYSTKDTNQLALVSDYWQKAAIPAYNRSGIRDIGLFTEIADSPTNKVYVLIPFGSWSALEGMLAKLAADKDYQTAAGDFMNRSKNNAPYSRLDVTLLHAMTGMPSLAVPPTRPGQGDWMFELRTYFSPTEAKGANKVDMFNDGEIQVMKEVGLHPVFFAGAIAGPQLPNLIYMVSGANRDEMGKAWKGFGPHPAWKKLQGDPKYKDNMTGIQNAFLKRLPGSQI